MVRAAFANSAWWLASAPSCAAFERALSDPARAQERVLQRLLRDNTETEFGREHGFSDIKNAEQFSQRIPPRDYDQLLPYIDRIRRGEPNVLTREPVRRLVPTSGSTAARKLIPYTAAMQGELNRAIAPWIYDLFRRHPRAMRGSAYWSISPALPDDNFPTEESAIPIGFDDDAEYLGGWRKGMINSLMAVLGEVKTIASIDAWRYVTLLLLLRRRDLSLISIWHPSFLGLLMTALRNEWPRLVKDVASGTCAESGNLPDSLARAIAARPDRRRAIEIERGGPDSLHRIWPMLGVVSCWADGQAAPAADAMSRSLPGIFVQPKGLLATEGVISIPFAGRHPLAVRSHYLEFEDDAGRISLAADLKTNCQYSVLLSTGGGLFRYRLHDLVEVDGWVGRTPSIRFIGKAGVISDRMGEKLTDGFVCSVLQRLFVNRSAVPSFSMLAPEVDAEGCRYTLYVDFETSGIVATDLDVLLCENPHYDYCRRLGQLRPPRVTRIPGEAYEAYCRRLQSTGLRLGDIKPVGLSKLDGWSAYFAGGS